MNICQKKIYKYMFLQSQNVLIQSFGAQTTSGKKTIVAIFA